MRSKFRMCVHMGELPAEGVRSVPHGIVDLDRVEALLLLASGDGKHLLVERGVTATDTHARVQGTPQLAGLRGIVVMEYRKGDA